MFKQQRLFSQVLLFVVLALASASPSFAQKNKSDKRLPAGKAVLWHQVNVTDQDLFNGPGGEQMKPDLSNITFIERDTKGHN
jgi:hypothetical protein